MEPLSDLFPWRKRTATANPSTAQKEPESAEFYKKKAAAIFEGNSHRQLFQLNRDQSTGSIIGIAQSRYGALVGNPVDTAGVVDAIAAMAGETKLIDTLRINLSQITTSSGFGELIKIVAPNFVVNPDRSDLHQLGDFFVEMAEQAQAKSIHKLVVFENFNSISSAYLPDFILFVRSLFNGRAKTKEMMSLSVLMTGTASPDALQLDPTRSGYNIGFVREVSKNDTDVS